MGLEEFTANWNALSVRLEQALGISVADECHPLIGWMASGRRSYVRGDLTLGCAQSAYAQFAVEDLENVKAHDEKMFLHFKRELRRNLPAANYFGLRQELRLASAMLSKHVPFEKSETPDFTLNTTPKMGIECTSAHLSLDSGQSKPSVAYKVMGAISVKSQIHSTELQILAIDTSNLLFHEGVHEAPLLSHKTQLDAAIGPSVQSSQFQSVLIFAYAWVPAEIGNGATLTSYYSRVDRSEIVKPCKEFLDIYYPRGDVFVPGHLHQRV